MPGMLLHRETRWSCPNCVQTARTSSPFPHSRFHQCAGLHGLTVAMVEAGTDCKVEAVEREDYVGSELVQVAPGNGRPYSSAVTTRADGSNDCTVYAPTARGAVST
jgi:hypothetical protein